MVKTCRFLGKDVSAPLICAPLVQVYASPRAADEREQVNRRPLGSLDQALLPKRCLSKLQQSVSCRDLLLF
jgi:hypothetical protein